MLNIAKTFWGSLAACLLLSAGSAAQGPAQAVEAADSVSDESIQQQTQTSQGTTLYFPDYVDGGGWSVQLAISNVARSAAAAVVVTAYDQDGQPLPELFDSETTFQIPPLGSRVLRSAGTGEIRRGWIEVRTVPPSVSGLLTYRHSGSGVEVGVAPVRLGDRFALFVEESSEIGTGLALFKPEAESEVEIRIRDEAGSDPLGQDLTVGDFQQQARTLPEWFSPVGATFPGDFRGQLLLRSGEDSSFAPLGLRFGKRKTSLSAVPGIPFSGEGGDGPPNPFSPAQPAAGPLYFPDYVDGGGWSVQLVLGNLDPDRSVPVEVEVYDQQGRSVGGLFGSETRFELPAQGSRVLRSAGGTRIRRGWIKVEADGASVRGLLVYRHGETGIEVGVAPVEPRDQFALFVEESSEIGTGLALFKPDTDSRVEFRIRDEAGNDPLGDVYVPWRDFRQSARTLPEWLDVDGVETGFLKDFRGLLFLRTADGSEFAPLGLRFGKETSALSAVPGIGIVDGVRIDAGVGSDGGVEIDGGVGIDGGGQAPPPTVSLLVAPSSIDRGQSTTLRWSSTNAESVEITPDVGKVSTSGTQKVSPRTTTTYRITVRAADGQTATATATVRVAITDRAVLEVLYEATDGPNWVNNENWLTDAPLGEWYGVEVDSQGRVIGLRLFTRIETEEGNRTETGIGLTGVIPPELGSLSHLRVLDLRWNQLTGPIPPELGSLSNLGWLYLWGNQLTGPIPPELGSLSNLQELYLDRNQLTGPIPPSFLQLEQLGHFYFSDNLEFCAPGTAGFVDWLKGIEQHDGPYCNQSDVAVIESLYQATGGANWTNSDGWLGEGAVSDWYGIRADSLGRVTGLDLSDNGLEGRVPGNLGQLSQMTELRIDGNALSGRLPLGLARLPLQEFLYADTELCAPVEASFQAWLNAIPSHDGTNMDCAPLTDRDILVSLYDATGGPDWTNNENWLTDTSLGDWSGVEVDGRGRVIGLRFSQNGLAGPIPPDLGSLSNLQELYLDRNQLTGPIPPDLGSLSNLQSLYLWGNQLTGPIPPDLGSLSNLQSLYLDQNQLTGPIPPELGGMEHLRTLSLSRNAEMSGALPARLTDLLRLEALLAVDTRLCVPSDARFQNWLERVWKRRIAPCFSDGLPKAYLTQAVQSREFPVPLVAGEDALLRVFVTAPRATEDGLPPVRAKFYRNEAETYVVETVGKSTPIPTGVREGLLLVSVNSEVPGEIVQPSLEMVIEIDPAGTLGSGTGLTKRIPETRRIAVEVREMPVFELTVIPFLWTQSPDRSVLDIVRRMAMEPRKHPLLQQTLTLLPIGDMHVRVHSPVMSSNNNSSSLIHETEVIRTMEGGDGHYMGTMTGQFVGIDGKAKQNGWITFSKTDLGDRSEYVIAHELGHNIGLQHPYGCNAADPDPSFPYPGGTIGAWGYDFERGVLVSPHVGDLMSYCGSEWISDYHFTNALRYRLHTAASGGQSSLVAAPARSLLLWGGVDAGGTPFLEPAFVVEAPASLPRSTGEYQIIGRTADGDELFSLTFEMPTVADGDGSSSFAFVLPVQPEWPESLASITLSGPGGSATLDDKTDRPLTILRNSRTGQIRGILRDGSAAGLARDDAVSALSREPDMEALNSRGIPDSGDWTR